jgi:hypothetical protein
MAKYMLLLHDNPASFADVSPEQMQKVIEKYMAWGNRLRQAGLMHAGDKPPHAIAPPSLFPARSPSVASLFGGCGNVIQLITE